MKKFRFDQNGLGFAELTRLAMTHPFLFWFVEELLKFNMPRMALAIARASV